MPDYDNDDGLMTDKELRERARRIMRYPGESYAQAIIEMRAVEVAVQDRILRQYFKSRATEEIISLRAELDRLKTALGALGFHFDGNIVDAALHYIGTLREARWQDKLAETRQQRATCQSRLYMSNKEEPHE